MAELLVVIAIISALFAIAIPAIDSITSRSRLDAAANAVHSAAKLARQHAVAQSEPAYVVFNEGQTDPSLAYVAYRLFAIDVSSGSPRAEDGYWLGDWKRLPVGVVFDPIPTDGYSGVFSRGSQWNGGFGRDRRLLIEGHAYNTLGFPPRGSRAVDAGRNDVHLAEGFHANGSIQRVSDLGKRVSVWASGKSAIIDHLYEGEIE